MNEARAPQNVPKIRIPPAVQRFADAVVNRSGASESIWAERFREALTLVPRDHFLDARYKPRALEDSRLPSGVGQFTHAPHFLIKMFLIAGVAPGKTVLELECGAGYSSALMCVIGARVFATESIGLRAQTTRRQMDQLGLNRILISTGYHAWVDSAPFDCIVSHKPFESEDELQSLLKLLEPNGGRIVAPLAENESHKIVAIEMREGSPINLVF